MKALILVDLQNDFADPEGSLYVSKGEEVIPIANQLTSSLKFGIVVATQDWHVKGHSSFASSNKKSEGWPDHCIWNTQGAEFHKNPFPKQFYGFWHLQSTHSRTFHHHAPHQ